MPIGLRSISVRSSCMLLLSAFAMLSCYSIANAQDTSDQYMALVAEAKVDLNAGNAARALELSDEAIKLDPSRWQAYVGAAGALEQQRNFDSAVDMLTDALGKAPDDKKPAIKNTLENCMQEKLEASEPAPPNAEQPDPQNSALAVARSNERILVSLATGIMMKVKGGGKKELFEEVWTDQYQNQAAISFPATYFCRQTLLYGQVGWCASGRIYVTATDVIFQRVNGSVEFLSPRATTVIKSEGGREGDTYSVYVEGKRYRFGSEKFDSRFMNLLLLAVTQFPEAYNQMHVLAAMPQ
jgi:tetratricopeptide (TPR) repeat protein